MPRLKHEGLPYKYPPLTRARHSDLQPSDLERQEVTKLVQGLTNQHRI